MNDPFLTAITAIKDRIVGYITDTGEVKSDDIPSPHSPPQPSNVPMSPSSVDAANSSTTSTSIGSV